MRSSYGNVTVVSGQVLLCSLELCLKISKTESSSVFLIEAHYNILSRIYQTAVYRFPQVTDKYSTNLKSALSTYTKQVAASYVLAGCYCVSLLFPAL